MGLKGRALRDRRRSRLAMGAGRAPLKLGPVARMLAGVALVALLVVRLAFVELVVVSGNTMAPAILDGDVLLVLSQARAQPGDVVLVETGGKTVLRRVIGQPGDRLGSIAGVLTRDDVPVPTQVAGTFAWREATGTEATWAQHRQYQLIEALTEGGPAHTVLGDHVGAAHPWTLELPEVEVPPGSLFVLCDNRRLCPLDERAGLIPDDAVQGVARSLLWYGEARAEPPAHRPFYGAFVPLASAAPEGGTGLK